jgi:hypothetical protein
MRRVSLGVSYALVACIYNDHAGASLQESGVRRRVGGPAWE